MAADQVGTGSLTLGAPATAAATYVTVPSGAIIENVSVKRGGDPQMETQFDSEGAFHTDIWYEKRQDTATVVVVGKAYGKSAIGATDVAGMEVMTIDEEYSKGPRRTTVGVKKITFT